jgi:hypothetical protein
LKGIKFISENKISLVMKTPLGTEYPELNSFEGKVTMQDSDKVLTETFAVLPKAPSGTILLGITFLVKARAEIRAYNQSVTFGHFTNARTSLPVKYTFGVSTSSVMLTLVSEKEVIIPPTAKQGGESRPFEISVNVMHEDFDIIRDESIGGEIRQCNYLANQHGVFTRSETCKLNKLEQKSLLVGKIRLHNITNEPVILKAGQQVAELLPDTARSAEVNENREADDILRKLYPNGMKMSLKERI